MNRDPIEEIGSPGARSFISWYTRTLAIRATLHLASAMDQRNSPVIRLRSILRMLDDLDRIDWAHRGNPMLGLSYASPNPLLFVANDSVNLLDYLGLLDVSRRDPASVVGGIIGGLRRTARNARKQVEDAARQAGLPVDEAKQLRNLMPDRQLEEGLKRALRTALAECDIDPEQKEMIEKLLDIIVEKLKDELLQIPDKEGDSLAEQLTPAEGRPVIRDSTKYPGGVSIEVPYVDSDGEPFQRHIIIDKDGNIPPEHPLHYRSGPPKER